MQHPDAHSAYRRKAERSLTAARSFLESGESDGACTRAYDAMEYAARVVLLAAKMDEPADGDHSHQDLIGAFGKYPVLGGRIDPAPGRSLDKAQHFGQLADLRSALSA